jgi:putative phosphoesterase
VTCVGLISDTHVPNRLAALPPAVFENLTGVNLILHAGDLDDPAILDQLRQIAPARAVRGNRHLLMPWPNDQQLPLYLDLVIEGHRVVLTHGHLSTRNNFAEKLWLFVPDRRRRVNQIIVKRLTRRFPGADVYVFGHTHLALVERRNGALFVNPGAVCPARGQVASMGRLRLMPGCVEADIIPL